jgi:maleylacetate reductase
LQLVAEFTEVSPHVPREAVDAARRLADENDVDVVVALGGGSAIGVGKGVVLEEGLSVFTVGRRRLIAIPTTYAGSEMTSVFGSTNREKGQKSVKRNLTVLPTLVFYDPEVTLDLPDELTASTAINALAHCVEATYARDAHPVVPPVALEGIRRIVRSLPRCMANGHDLEARSDLLTGAYLAGFSIGNGKMALHHGICHVLGGRTLVAHGVLNTIMLPHVMRFMADAVPEAMRAMAEAMDSKEQSASEAVAALVATLPVPHRLRDAGVPEDILDWVAAEAGSNSRIRGDPKPVTDADVREILQAAW